MHCIESPEPRHPAAGTLLRHLRSWCSPDLAKHVQITGERVALPWRVVHAIQTTRDISLGAVVSELHQYGHVLADDNGLTIVGPAR